MEQILQLKSYLEQLYIDGKIQHYEGKYCQGKYTSKVKVNDKTLESKAMLPDDDNSELIEVFKKKIDKELDNGKTNNIKTKSAKSTKQKS